MKDKILKRLQELTKELETQLEYRDFHLQQLRNLDPRIKELSILINELNLLVKDELRDEDIKD